MPLVIAAMAPHGFSLVPDMNEDAEGGMKTRESLFEMGSRFTAATPDVIVIATPHGFRVDGTICIANAGRGAGTLKWAGKQVEQNVPFDIPFANRLAQAARERDVPISLASFGGGGENGVLPIDWGVITPLWFAAFPRNMTGHGDVLASAGLIDSGPTVVVVCPARDLPAKEHVAFGEALADAAAADDRRIAYIASCDWSHRHSADGPYGYSDVAKVADERILSAVKGEDLGSLTSVTPEDVSSAAMDGIPQTLILAGLIDKTKLAVEVLSYEAPTYYGMIVAIYQ